MINKWHIFDYDLIAGNELGIIIGEPVTGVLCQYGFDGGWASAFYVFGKFIGFVNSHRLK